jgi:tetratricopeptide (TPR) repeat protein
MTRLSRPETATQIRSSHRQQRPKKRRYRPLPTKPDSRRARPPMKAFFLDEQDILTRPGLRADACLKMFDWAGAIVDLDTLIRLDPNYAEIFNERGFARRRLGDLQGARDDFDRCITIGTDLPLAYGNRAEVELMLGDESAAAADIAQAKSLAAAMPDSPPASSTPSARKNQTHHETPKTGTSNNAKGTTR